MNGSETPPRAEHNQLLIFLRLSRQNTCMEVAAAGTAHQPRLRPYVEPAQDHRDPDHVYLVDRLGLIAEPVRLTVQEYFWLRLFDGRRSLQEIQVEAIGQAGGQLLPLERFARLAMRLNDALLLDGPSFRRLVDNPVRAPRCIGCYDGEPCALRRQIDRLFTGPQGPGLPKPPATRGDLVAAFVPHIDFPRGGSTYAWGYKDIFEHTAARLFVIVGTSHYSTHRFTLTRKSFQTPLGIMPTDQDYIDRLVRHYGDGLFDDELGAHLPEHSIELEAVWLQHLYAGNRDIRIVPLVVGSFFDCVERRRSPAQCDDIGRMIEALRRAEAETPEPICYLISGDLAHIGPKFGDRDRVAKPHLQQSRQRDQDILEQLQSANAERFFDVIAAEGDARRICGLPPAYTVLEAVRPAGGKALHYDQYIHPTGYESVSFASVAFYR